MTDANGTQIYYYVNGERYAYRRRNQIPRIGDEVRLNNAIYKVALVVWIEDQKPDYNNHVAIELEQPISERKSKRKALSSAENGKLGGRPAKNKPV